VRTTINLYDNGTEDVEVNGVEWGDDNDCMCHDCNFDGTVKDFHIANQKGGTG